VLDPDPESRRLLREALNAAGLVNPPGMWWHWSYGDTYWSYRSEAVAHYGPLQ
jgi:D-alanyl-D-alanine dipeptidase